MPAHAYVRSVCRAREIPQVSPGVVATRHKRAPRQQSAQLPRLWSADAAAVGTRNPLYIQ